MRREWLCVVRLRTRRLCFKLLYRSPPGHVSIRRRHMRVVHTQTSGTMRSRRMVLRRYSVASTITLRCQFDAAMRALGWYRQRSASPRSTLQHVTRSLGDMLATSGTRVGKTVRRLPLTSTTLSVTALLRQRLSRSLNPPSPPEPCLPPARSRLQSRRRKLSLQMRCCRLCRRRQMRQSIREAPSRLAPSYGQRLRGMSGGLPRWCAGAQCPVEMWIRHLAGRPMS